MTLLCQRTTLWAHQEKAVAFVLSRWDLGWHGAMLAMIMGSGKSRVAIELIFRKIFRLVLIVCPLRVVQVWADQFEKHCPGEYDFLALDDRVGTVTDKVRLARDRLAWATARGRKLVIAINYESARREPFAHWALTNIWPLTIADESHRFKKNSGSISRFMGKLAKRSVHRLALTGTPMPHSPLDVWAQFRFVDNDVYDHTYTAYQLKYALMSTFQTGTGQSFSKVVGWQNMEDFREKFFHLAFQVGTEVLDLPEESDQDLFTAFDPQYEGARIYDEMERELVAELEPGVELIAKNDLSKLLRLQQITSGAITDEDRTVRRVDFSKAKLLEDLLEDLPGDEAVVVFCRFRPDLQLVHQIARTLGRRSGEVSGERSMVTGLRDDLAAWQRGGPEDPVILAVQLQAGGVGIDLTRARYGVYYSVGFNLGDYVQSRARLQRAGQKRNVMFYHLHVRGTVDGMVARALARRQDLVEYVLRELQCLRHLQKKEASDPKSPPSAISLF